METLSDDVRARRPRRLLWLCLLAFRPHHHVPATLTPATHMTNRPRLTHCALERLTFAGHVAILTAATRQQPARLYARRRGFVPPCEMATQIPSATAAGFSRKPVLPIIGRCGYATTQQQPGGDPPLSSSSISQRILSKLTISTGLPLGPVAPG